MTLGRKKKSKELLFYWFYSKKTQFLMRHKFKALGCRNVTPVIMLFSLHACTWRPWLKYLVLHNYSEIKKIQENRIPYWKYIVSLNLVKESFPCPSTLKWGWKNGIYAKQHQTITSITSCESDPQWLTEMFNINLH